MNAKINFNQGRLMMEMELRKLACLLAAAGRCSELYWTLDDVACGHFTLLIKIVYGRLMN